MKTPREEISMEVLTSELLGSNRPCLAVDIMLGAMRSEYGQCGYVTRRGPGADQSRRVVQSSPAANAALARMMYQSWLAFEIAWRQNWAGLPQVFPAPRGLITTQLGRWRRECSDGGSCSGKIMECPAMRCATCRCGSYNRGVSYWQTLGCLLRKGRRRGRGRRRRRGKRLSSPILKPVSCGRRKKPSHKRILD
ncbi:hypothetical protein LZ32DRAFT_72469 [Colletotrichum eremochloae]|nr:hypothetical protein LZ32DRAFT_72469 [Colletotrichum eremochloae]